MNKRQFISYSMLAYMGQLGSGCASHTITQQDLQAAGWPRLTMPPCELPPRSLALVLGSGGPRGFAHVGVLKALEEIKLVPDMVVGASVGAIIGALLAARISAAEIEKLALNLGMWDIMDLTWESIRTRSFYTGNSVGELVSRISQQRDIRALPLPFAAAATRVSKDRKFDAAIFNAGSLPLAVRASAAVVGTAPEVQIDGTMYCDADFAVPLPARLARELGAKRVIAVDVSAYDEDTPDSVRNERPTWIAEAKRRTELTRAELPHVDVYLHIRTPYFTGFSEAYRKQLITQGYEQTMKRSSELLKISASNS